jgi:hypothetical protein
VKVQGFGFGDGGGVVWCDMLLRDEFTGDFLLREDGMRLKRREGV